MSADLLRRAAEKLREHAGMSSSPWTAETHVDGRAWVDAPGYPHAWCMTGFPCEAEYIALMHPPVALALAEWLSLEAGMVGKRTTGAEGNSPEGHTFHALAVARAILREDAP